MPARSSLFTRRPSVFSAPPGDAESSKIAATELAIRLPSSITFCMIILYTYTCNVTSGCQETTGHVNVFKIIHFHDLGRLILFIIIQKNIKFVHCYKSSKCLYI